MATMSERERKDDPLVDRLRDAAMVLAPAPLRMDKEAGDALAADCDEGAVEIERLRALLRSEPQGDREERDKEMFKRGWDAAKDMLPVGEPVAWLLQSRRKAEPHEDPDEWETEDFAYDAKWRDRWLADPRGDELRAVPLYAAPPAAPEHPLGCEHNPPENYRGEECDDGYDCKMKRAPEAKEPERATYPCPTCGHVHASPFFPVPPVSAAGSEEDVEGLVDELREAAFVMENNPRCNASDYSELMDRAVAALRTRTVGEGK